ncbi:molecular chaperone HtpG [Romboutsia sp.]|uniref:molecular chaperone HtpG n=1 Tax=Romboutsia sp. TaxID=1965302 RepID=UPI003F38C627
MNNQKGSISIHTENIFPIIKKWLYSDKDIFVRELISNGCDAVNKHKKLISLGEIEGQKDQDYKINVYIDKENSALIFEDNGIGMTEEEVQKYINQVAFSGAEDFFNKYKDKMTEENDIIGHFGLGFYSSFMVAEKVQIDTLSYQENATPVRWISEGGTEYEITESDNRTTRGTTITLFLQEDSKEFLEEYTLRNIIEKYCSFLPVNIYLNTKNEEIQTEEPKEDEEVKVPTPINETTPLWQKSPKDCTDEEYKEFYRKVFKTFDEPLFWIHLNVDYPFNLKGILYFPKLKNEFELIEGKVKLYNNQVFVADNIKEVIPEFLLLLKGVIDCPDLPLNVSRSFLQNDRDVSKISKHIVKKVADKLKSLYKNEKESYEKFWDDIQVFIKFGCLKDESFYDKIKDIILFKTINSEYITIDEYLEKCKEKHENKVFYVSNEEQQSQYIKLFKDYELDAVILDSTIDNHFISMMEYKKQGINFNRIDADLSDVLKENNEENSESKIEIEALFKEAVGERIKTYSVESLKSEETTAIILVSEQSRRMAEMKSQFAGMDFGMSFEEEKTLVINNNSPVIKKIVTLKDDESKKEQVELICNQIVDIALLANKELDSKELDDFIKRNNKLMNMIISL